jgi:AraC-like DNA-binding protein
MRSSSASMAMPATSCVMPWADANCWSGKAKRCSSIRTHGHSRTTPTACVGARSAFHSACCAPASKRPTPRQAGLDALIADYARNIVIGAFDAAFETTAAARGREIIGHLCGLLGLAIRDSTDPRAATPGLAAAGRLTAIAAYVDANCTDPTLSPASVAARFGISVRYLDKLFRRTGTSFTETLLRRRLSACCEMLSENGGSRRISEVARRAGFTTLTQFNRRFRATYGVTPRAWLARQR